MVKGHSDDWVFEQDENGIIIRVGKYGYDNFNMCGIAWFKAKDAKIIADAIVEAYKYPNIRESFLDDIVSR